MPVALSALIALLCTAVAWSAQAAPSTIYKCLADGAPQYQNVPCGPEQVSVSRSIATTSAVSSAPKETMPPETEAMKSASASTTETIEPFRFVRGGELAVGMSDTVVLNHPRWGRPQNIARLRAPDGFREEWTYVSRADGSARTLRFLNGRLVAIDDARPAVAVRAPDRVDSVDSTGASRASQGTGGIGRRGAGAACSSAACVSSVSGAGSGRDQPRGGRERTADSPCAGDTVNQAGGSSTRVSPRFAKSIAPIIARLRRGRSVPPASPYRAAWR